MSAALTREQILEKLRATQVQLVVCARTYEAAKQLFDAACFAGDGQLADAQRTALHTALDEMLDQAAGAMTLTRKLMEHHDD